MTTAEEADFAGVLKHDHTAEADDGCALCVAVQLVEVFGLGNPVERRRQLLSKEAA